MTQRVPQVFLMAVILLMTATILPSAAWTVTVFQADGTPLSEDAMTPPANPTPVLFVHGHDPDPDAQHPNYRKNFHDPRGNLPSFKLALDLAENRCLGIEPYYIHFGDTDASQHRSIDDDAAEIREAVTSILARHRLRDPNNPNLKLAIIAYSKGTISTRKYLKQLHEAGSPIPVSEFIAISPPNHGLRSLIAGSTSARQLNNGYDYNCESFGDESLDYIKTLNGHPIEDSQSTPGSYSGEAPGSRENGAGVDQGVLYVAIYAANNGDFVGGSTPSDDCQGRVLAKNLALHAVNMDDIEIPTQPPPEPLYAGDRVARHQNTVHHPEVIFRALFTVVQHRTPPDGTTLSSIGNVPVVPIPGGGQTGAAVVLLFDNSGSMAWSHDGMPGVDPSFQRISLARQAAVPFLDMLQFFNPCRASFGIARFPRQPYQGCFGEVITPLTQVQPDTIAAAIDATIPGLAAAGSTPLLAGLVTAAGMFGVEDRKALVLLSDGFHNCPPGSGLDDIGQAINDLTSNSIRTYAIGFGQPGEVPNDILGQLGAQTGGGHYDVTTAAGFDPAAWNPATALQAVYKSILVDAMQLDAAADPAGLIRSGERRIHEFFLSELDRKVAVFVSWAGPLKQRPALVLRASDGSEIPYRQTLTGVSVRDGESFTLVKIDSAFLGRPGKVAAQPWSLELAAGAEGDVRPAVPYQWSVVTDSGLSLKAEVKMKEARTGAVLTLTARLAQNGRPPALPATVWARVARPLEGVANWLAASRVAPEELARVPEVRGEEALSPLLRKIIYLTEFRKQPFAGHAAIDTVRLYDDGTHGDSAAGDGIYTGRFEGTTVAGTYAFDINASGVTSAGIPFERNLRIERHIPMKADALGAEAFRLPVDDKDMDIFEITLRPADAYGNLLGPGRQHMMLWEATAGGGPEPVVDHLDGTYSRRLKLPAGSSPAAVDLNLMVGDSPFRLNLGKVLQPAHRVPVGWLVLLLLIFMALLIRMLKNQRG